MPEARLQRTREAYLGTRRICPYCWGTAYGEDIHQCADAGVAMRKALSGWRSLHENAAEQLHRNAFTQSHEDID